MTFLSEANAIIKLAFPVFVAQLFITSMGFVDAIMTGHFTKTDLAAIAVGGSFSLPAFLFTEAILFSVTPLVAHAQGKHSPREASEALQQGLWLGFFFGVAVAMLLIAALPLLLMIGVDPGIAVISKRYLLWIAITLPVVGVYQAMRSYIEGNGRTKPVMFINGLGFFAHIPLNFLFIYGEWGVPALGGEGCGVAMLISMLLMALGLLMYILWSDLRIVAFSAPAVLPSMYYQIQLLRLGLPIGLSMLAEVSIFSVIALLVSPLGENVIAGHQVALNLSAQTFMLPFSLGMALTIRVGYFLGERNTVAARHTAKTGLLLALVSASCTASFMVFGSHFITAIYTHDVSVQAIAASLLFFAAIFQFPDAIQVSSIGILRGFKITRLPMVFTLLAYWGLALPVGYALGLLDIFGEPMGARGLWLGLVIGLSMAAVLLLSTVFYVMRHPEKHLSNCDI